MGYPGKPTDDLMELIDKLCQLVKSRTIEAGMFYDVAKLDDQIFQLKNKIRAEINALDSSEDDYHRDTHAYE